MKTIALCFGILLSLVQLSAQEQSTVFEYSGLKLTGIWGGPAFAGSGIGDESVYMRGGFGGLEFNKRIYLAYAAYWLNEDAALPQLPELDIDFRYRGLLAGYAFKPDKIVHPKVAVLVGGGTADIDGEDSDRVFVVQPTAGIEINVFKWWHIDILGGYRLVQGVDATDNNLLSDDDLSAPFGEIKLRFGISWGWH